MSFLLYYKSLTIKSQVHTNAKHIWRHNSVFRCQVIQMGSAMNMAPWLFLSLYCIVTCEINKWNEIPRFPVGYVGDLKGNGSGGLQILKAHTISQVFLSVPPQGDDADGCYFIEDGSVRITMKNKVRAPYTTQPPPPTLFEIFILHCFYFNLRY